MCVPCFEYVPVLGKTGLLPWLTFAVVTVETTDAILGQSFDHKKQLDCRRLEGTCMWMYARLHRSADADAHSKAYALGTCTKTFARGLAEV
jgi:hypothetical protein